MRAAQNSAMASTLSRRAFGTAAAISAATAFSTPVTAAAPGNFVFAHMTDLHIQPELRAGEGCRMAFDDSRKLKLDFVLGGGDMVFDAADQKPDRARKLYAMLGEATKRLEIPLHSCLGNHDVFGTSAQAGVARSEAGWGKKMFEDRMGVRCYRSFDHKGWHFVILDSIEITPAGGYRGFIDAAQLDWLKADLAKAGKAPTIVLTHIPLLSGAANILGLPVTKTDEILVANAREVTDAFAAGNVKMVLQGHTHICEKVEYHGVQYITSGAVCGNWWKGIRLGFPEGYGVIRVAGEQAVWEYRSYGFKAA